MKTPTSPVAAGPRPLATAVAAACLLAPPVSLLLGPGTALPAAAAAPDPDTLSPPRFATSLTGIVQSVDTRHGQIKLIDGSGQVHTVGASVAAIARPEGDAAPLADVKAGMRLTVTGSTSLDGDRFDARIIRILVGAAGDSSSAPAPAGPVRVDGVISACDIAHSRATIADIQGNRYVVDYVDADLRRAGSPPAPNRLLWLTRGMRVLVTGTPLENNVIIADKVAILSGGPDTSVPAPTTDVVLRASNVTPLRTKAFISKAVLPPPDLSFPTADVDDEGGVQMQGAIPDAPVPASPDPKAVLASLDQYTGILIDARHLRQIGRSPAPAIFGADVRAGQLYPDKANVPTADEVQDESVVRYYHTEEEAECATGCAGAHPLILPAQAVYGPAKDCVRLSASDTVLLKALEQKLHFSQTWKVGFLIPANQ